ncbi:aminopeptidase [Enterococcus camelliae]|uniref:Aminopeptidase n=1 Tax=Enterococcus camelliae TaxID=453959 RepID=A0ABW5TJC6_9ENTE
MNKQLLQKLSNADAVASQEMEVRNIIRTELREYENSFQYDGLGSLIVTKKSDVEDAPTIMFAAHMDEVGFLVRNISDIGMLALTPIGGVLDKSKENQMVRITTASGRKIEGLLNVSRDASGKIQSTYVDVGVNSREEVAKLGIDIGDMVCFSSNFRNLNDSSVFAGKALDDRVGVYALIVALKKLQSLNLPVHVTMAFTSSEEVGTRGGKLVADLIHPDLFFAVDVANHPELIRDYTNQRLIGKGPMLVHYDKTMVPNKKLIHWLKQIFEENNFSYQKDMFGGGGTDAGFAHLTNGGILAAVLGIPLRYCHSPYSFVQEDDLAEVVKMIVAIAKNASEEQIATIKTF